MTLTWLCLALAAMVVPISRSKAHAPGSGQNRPSLAATTTRRDSRTGLVLAVLGLAGGCVAVLGPVTGGLVAAVAGPPVAYGLRALQRRPAALPINRSVALALDLTAAALRAGRPLSAALVAAAPAADEPVEHALRRVAGLVRLGADPEQAWSVLARDGPLAAVAVAAVRSATSGVRLATAFERLGAEIRADASTASAARAHRAGIVAMAPLAACFLPSFVCLGVVPVVVGIARSALGSLP